MTLAPASLRIPEREIDIIETARRSSVLRLDRDLSFSTASLEFTPSPAGSR